MIVTGLVMILLFCGFVYFSGFAGREHPNCGGTARTSAFEKPRRIECENQKILTQYHWMDKTRGWSEFRSIERWTWFSSIASQQAAPGRADEYSRCAAISGALSNRSKAGRSAMSAGRLTGSRGSASLPHDP